MPHTREVALQALQSQLVQLCQLWNLIAVLRSNNGTVCAVRSRHNTPPDDLLVTQAAKLRHEVQTCHASS